MITPRSSAEAVPQPPPSRSPSVLRIAAERPGVLMALWGLVAVLLTTLVLVTITPSVWPTTDGRGAALRESMIVLDHGGPLLVGRYHGATGAYYDLKRGDDEGVYVYVPVISRLFGVSDPLVMLRYIYIALVSLTAAIYPAVFYRLTGSLLAGIAAPFLFVACIVSMGFLDIYWIPAWGALTTMPLLFLLVLRDWPRYGLLALAGVSLVASWMSSIRSDSGLGVAIAAAAVLAMRRWRWWRLLPALVVLAVVYISIGTFVFGAIRADRDHRLGSAAKTVDVTTAHTLWHTAYAGLGYLPNKYGLRFNDGVPNARVKQEAPNVVFLSSRYEAIIRRAYLGFVRAHPLEVIRQYAAKMVVAIADVAPYLLIVLATLPAALLMGPDRRLARRWYLLSIPPMVVALLPVLMALPMESYEQGLYGAIGVVGIVGLCRVLGLVETAVRKRGGARSMTAAADISWSALVRSPAPGWKSARISIVAVVVLVFWSFGGYFVRRESIHWQGGRTSVLMEYI